MYILAAALFLFAVLLVSPATLLALTFASFLLGATYAGAHEIGRRNALRERARLDLAHARRELAPKPLQVLGGHRGPEPLDPRHG